MVLAPDPVAVLIDRVIVPALLARLLRHAEPSQRADDAPRASRSDVESPLP